MTMSQNHSILFLKKKTLFLISQGEAEHLANQPAGGGGSDPQPVGAGWALHRRRGAHGVRRAGGERVRGGSRGSQRARPLPGRLPHGTRLHPQHQPHGRRPAPSFRQGLRQNQQGRRNHAQLRLHAAGHPAEAPAPARGQVLRVRVPPVR